MHRRLHIISEHFKRALDRNSLSSMQRRRLLRTFAEKNGLVHFGDVDQHEDDHRVVRGFTASPTHKDSSFMTGTFEDRDVSVVDRFDMLFKGDHLVSKHRWLIGEFRLSSDDVPHVFLAPEHDSRVHYAKVFTAFRYLDRLSIEASADFTSRYKVLGSPSKQQEIEDLLDANVRSVVGAHFWPLAVEVFEGSVYLYSCDQKLSHHALQVMLKNGTWLSQVLDDNMNR